MRIRIDLYTDTPEDLAVLEAVTAAARANPPPRRDEVFSTVEAGRSDIAMQLCQAPVEVAAVVPPPPPVEVAAVVPPPPPPPPPPPVEVAAVVPPPPPVEVAAGNRDSDGLPWDGRIHSSSKARLADGRWRQRRNTDPAVVTAVTAELRAALSAPAAPSAPVAAVPLAPVATVFPFPPIEEPAAVPPPPAATVLPFPFPPIEDPAVPPPPAAMTFPEFMRAITAARLAPGVVLEACKAVGMSSIPALNQRPDLIPSVAAALGVS